MRTLIPLSIVLLGLATSCGGAGVFDFPGSDSGFRSMTRNLYMGTELNDAIGAILSGDQEAAVVAVAEAFGRVQATDFPTRARGIANEIQAVDPDLIGLQEAALWRTQYPADSVGPEPTPAETVAYDFVQILLDELALRGLDYEVAAEFRGVDVEFPGLTPEYDLMDVRFTDREVILAKRGGRVSWTNAQTGAFLVNLPIMEGLDVTRGWASVDATIPGGRCGEDHIIRFVTTHLEADHPDVRMAQAGEILEGPTATELPVVLVGDFNYDMNSDDPGPAWFRQVVGEAGFALAAPTSGSTCCGDELVQDPGVVYTERLDLILCRGGFVASSEAIHGDRPADMVEGLWPSDHGGVSCALELPKEGPDLLP